MKHKCSKTAQPFYVISVADPGCLSRIRTLDPNLFHPGSRVKQIPDAGEYGEYDAGCGTRADGEGGGAGVLPPHHPPYCFIFG